MEMAGVIPDAEAGRVRDSLVLYSTARDVCDANASPPVARPAVLHSAEALAEVSKTSAFLLLRPSVFEARASTEPRAVEDSTETRAEDSPSVASLPSGAVADVRNGDPNRSSSEVASTSSEPLSSSSRSGACRRSRHGDDGDS